MRTVVTCTGGDDTPSGCQRAADAVVVPEAAVEPEPHRLVTVQDADVLGTPDECAERFGAVSYSRKNGTVAACSTQTPYTSGRTRGWKAQTVIGSLGRVNAAPSRRQADSGYHWVRRPVGWPRGVA
jgi:hypothetical protein